MATLVETHRLMHRPVAEAADLGTERVELFEFHTVLFERDRLIGVGGPDERMLSQADHLDLALRVHDAGGSVWFEPASRVAFIVPERLRWYDRTFFLGRWSNSWTSSSHRAFAAKHHVDPDADPYGTWSFPARHRANAWLSLANAMNHVVFRRRSRAGIARRMDRAVGHHVAELVLRVAPRWRGGGREVAN